MRIITWPMSVWKLDFFPSQLDCALCYVVDSSIFINFLNVGVTFLSSPKTRERIRKRTIETIEKNKKKNLSAFRWICVGLRTNNWQYTSLRSLFIHIIIMLYYVRLVTFVYYVTLNFVRNKHNISIEFARAHRDVDARRRNEAVAGVTRKQKNTFNDLPARFDARHLPSSEFDFVICSERASLRRTAVNITL